MKENSNDSIALLIDADNAPATKIDFILTELASHGVINIRKAYGNWKKQGLSGWEKILHDHAIQPIQHFDLVKGKNATDMGLLIDAMDILYTKEIQTFCLVSSDCDFTPLIMRIRADGKQVIGFGGKNTPEPFINSCTHFIYLEQDAKSKSGGAKEANSANGLTKNKKLMTTLRNAVEANEDEDGWARLGLVGHHIKNQGPFDHQTYGFSKLSDLFAAINLFEVEKKKKNNLIVVQVKLKKTSAKKASK